MFEFNSTEIWVNYIKQILYRFNLPQCRIFNNENELIDFYSEAPGIDTYAIIRGSESFSPIIVRYKDSVVKEVSKYKEGGYFRNLTKNLSLLNNQYDSYTHRYLGDYLRFIRDYNNLNLMSFYNCYDNTYKEDTSNKYLIIPIKYNKEYTLAFTSSGCKYAFTTDTSLGNLQTIFLDANKPNVLKQSKFNNPLIITSPKTSREQLGSEDYKYDYFEEENLRLVIKVDINNKNKLTVLEGNYSKNQNKNVNIVINHEKEIILANENWDTITLKPEDAYNKVNIEELISTNLSLLEKDIFKANTQIPFWSRLFEFLIHNTITDRYEVTWSALEVKEKLGLKNNSRFRNYERLVALEKANLKDTKDLTGYIDKDMEVNI